MNNYLGNCHNIISIVAVFLHARCRTNFNISECEEIIHIIDLKIAYMVSFNSFPYNNIKNLYYIIIRGSFFQAVILI